MGSFVRRCEDACSFQLRPLVFTGSIRSMSRVRDILNPNKSGNLDAGAEATEGWSGEVEDR